MPTALATMSASSVLRIGPFDGPVCAASFLRSAVLSHLGNDNDEDHGRGGNILSIRNKYFSAEVALEYLCVDDSAGEVIASTSLAGVSGDDARTEDGMILVFNAIEETRAGTTAVPFVSFESLSAVHNYAVADGTGGDLLRLCVGVGLHGPVPQPEDKVSEGEYSRRVLWCLDRGYEYVEADLSEAGTLLGHDEREKDGFARVIEAVSSTVFSSAAMAPKNAPNLRKSYGGGATKVRDDRVAPACSVLTGAVGNGSDENQLGEEGKAGLTEISTVDGANDESKREEGLAGRPQTGLRIEREESESIFDDLESAIQQAAAVRAAAKSGELPDEERRKRAGDVAMTLSGLLGKMGFDESDEDFEESDNEEECS